MSAAIWSSPTNPLRAARMRAGLATPADLAEKSGVSRQQVDNIESGRTARPTAGTLIALGEACSIDSVVLGDQIASWNEQRAAAGASA